jgi:hypothetical protein
VLEVLLGLLVGITGGVIASCVYKIIEQHRHMYQVDIVGNWAERIPRSVGHSFSFGEIVFDKHRGMYAFDGTNFSDDGTPFCHWETVASHLDVNARQFFYIFTARLEGSLQNTYVGFGVVNLARPDDGQLVPVDGHYASWSVDDEPMSHSMVRMSDIVYRRGDHGRLIIQKLAEAAN